MPLLWKLVFKCSMCGRENDGAVGFVRHCCARDFHRRFGAGEFDDTPDLTDLHAEPRVDDDGAPPPEGD